MRASVGFSASSGMIQRLPALCAPGIRSWLQRMPTRRGEIPHFSAISNVERYFITSPRCLQFYLLLYSITGTISIRILRILPPLVLQFCKFWRRYFIFLQDWRIFWAMPFFSVHWGDRRNLYKDEGGTWDGYFYDCKGSSYRKTSCWTLWASRQSK